MRSPVAVFLAIVVAGLAVLALVGATKRDSLAFTLGVTNGGPVAELGKGQEVCQEPVRVPDSGSAFDVVVLSLGTYGRPGPPVEVTISPVAGGAPIARGQLARGYGDLQQQPQHRVRVGHVSRRDPLRICIGNLGLNRVAVYGNADASARTSRATIDGTPTGTDVNLAFERTGERSLLTRAPAMFSRASLWHASWFGGWTILLLALAVLIGVPALLVRALRATEPG
jgi:hypothetical protein